jgi:hypothetical protein
MASQRASNKQLTIQSDDTQAGIANQQSLYAFPSIGERADREA